MELNNLILQPEKNGKRYKLIEEYKYSIMNIIIIVQKGFITDMASVPRIFWNIFPPFGKYTPAAIIHDYLYSKYNHLGINRKESDLIFLEIMKELEVNLIKRNLMYRAVRMFGSSSWKKKEINL